MSATASWSLVVAAASCSFPEYEFTSDHEQRGRSVGQAGTGATGGQPGLVTAPSAGQGAGGAGRAGTGGVSSGGTAGLAGSGNNEAGAGADGGSSGSSNPAPARPTCTDLSAPASCTCAERDGYAYLFCGLTQTWSLAVERCKLEGMRLLRVDSSAENSWVDAQAVNIDYYWIGASSKEEKGKWRWVDGEQFWQGNDKGSPVGGRYFNWRAGTPSGGDDERCTTMNTEGWDDSNCDDLRPYVCEPDE